MTLPSGLWTEGDTLSPTNLNKRNPAGNFPAKMYHVAWAAGSGTTQINNAIVNAAAGGYTAVFIDASRLPYDASAVTFNSAVQMLREGGDAASAGLDLMAYGAAGNNSTNDTAAIQAWLNQALAMSGTNGQRVLRVPNGIFIHSKPIWVKSAVRIEGSRLGLNNITTQSAFRPSYVGGPIFLVENDSAVVSGLTTAIVSGTGQAWNATADDRRLTLRNHNRLLDLNGLSAFGVEVYCKGTGNGELVGSGGRFLYNDTWASCFRLTTQPGLTTFYVNLSGGPVTISSATSIKDNVRHDVEGNYDGSTVRLLIDGVVVASAVGNGTLVQSFAEDVTCGALPNQTPEGGAIYGNPSMALQSIRISNAAQHTSGYTPTWTTRSVNANTLALLNFDEQIGSLTKCQTKDGNAWVWEIDNTGATSFGLPGFSLDGVCTNNADYCIAVQFARRGQYEWSIDHLSVPACRCGVLAIDGYDNYLHRGFIKGGGGNGFGRYGFVVGATGGIGTFSDIWTQNFQIHYAIMGNMRISRAFLQLDTFTHTGFVVRNETSSSFPLMLDTVFVNTESGINTAKFRAPVLVGASTSLKFGGVDWRGGSIENGSGTSAPWIIIENSGGLSKFQSVAFIKTGATPTSVIQYLGAAGTPVEFNGCGQVNAWVPWSDTTGTAVLGRIGPLFSSSTGSALNFDASVADEWDLTLSSDVTQSNWTKISYGQPVSGAIKMDSTGSRLFVWPTNSKGTATLSYGSAAVNTFSGFYDGVNVILTSVRTGL